MRPTNRLKQPANLSHEEARLTALLAEGRPTDVIAREMGLDSVELHHLLTALGQKVEGRRGQA
ncbi:MAG: hypothetical protein KC482_14325 [Dehalococcoidia bacterium]|nr:hypothetical protein [Dehalococcoidia bacterium]MCA9826353.1 hypothetical protein [Dehalococcoidia bacterium]MCA9844596.1 hypothetical protein [Dehalococcoidia bacterium]MCA9854739.1 hypothetical protein [Dehalococcoidia bacterium]